MRRTQTAWLAVLLLLFAASLPAKEPPKGDPGWVSLFDGKSLGGWKASDMAGSAEPKVEDGAIILPFGSEMTGITYTGKALLRDNYEIELEAKRIDGTDFFCALTFPVKDDPCTLVCGGWGGGVVGLSSINGMDASENSTSSYHEFKKGQWYRIRVRVAEGQIQAWIGKQRVVDFPILDNAISIRSECEPCKPLGIATWCTTGAAKNIRIRKVAAKAPPEA